MSNEVLYRDVPSDYFVILLINGFLVLYLTPIHFLSPLFNPFTQSLPTEVLGSVGFITLFSFIVGFPGFLLREKIAGTGGLNDWVHHWGKVRKVNRGFPIENFRFNMWARKSGIERDLSFFGLKYAIGNGIIIGSELAAIANILFLLLLIVLGGIAKNTFFFLIGISIVSGIIWLIMWRLDKSYFKKSFDEQMLAASILYKEWVEENKECIHRPIRKPE